MNESFLPFEVWSDPVCWQVLLIRKVGCFENISWVFKDANVMIKFVGIHLSIYVRCYEGGQGPSGGGR
jgi:hypothetical protein